MHPRVQQAVLDTTRELLAEDADLLEADGRPFHKSQPHLLRQLAADRLYTRWRKACLAVSADDVLVCPYSSLTMLEAAMASVARPDGVILCPEGFYKSNRQHIEKLGLSIRLFPADLDRDGKIDAWHLRRAIQTHREQLCALLFTMPGNPRSPRTRRRNYRPSAGWSSKKGYASSSMRPWMRSYPIMFRSRLSPWTAQAGPSPYSTGPSPSQVCPGASCRRTYKIGAAITGDARWRADIRRQLAVPLQRETSALTPLFSSRRRRSSSTRTA